MTNTETTTRVHTVAAPKYVGNIWHAECITCSWSIWAAAEKHAEIEAGYHEDDMWKVGA